MDRASPGDVDYRDYDRDYEEWLDEVLPPIWENDREREEFELWLKNETQIKHGVSKQDSICQ